MCNDDFLEKLVDLIEGSQKTAESIIELITIEEKENDELNYLEAKASNLIKHFSNSYSNIFKSFSVPEKIDTAIKQFIKYANGLIKTLNYYVFFKFTLIELQFIAELIEDEFPAKFGVSFE